MADPMMHPHKFLPATGRQLQEPYEFLRLLGECGQDGREESTKASGSASSASPPGGSVSSSVWGGSLAGVFGLKNPVPPGPPFGPVIGPVNPGRFRNVLPGKYGRSYVLPVKSTAKCRDLARLRGA
jgi:hypothetical protein